MIHSFDQTKACVHDIHNLNDLKWEISDCTLLGDKGHISKKIQLDLFETTRIQLEVPYIINQKDFKPTSYKKKCSIQKCVFLKIQESINLSQSSILWIMIFSGILKKRQSSILP